MAQAAARTRRPNPTPPTNAKGSAKPSRLSASLLSLKSPSVQPKLTVNPPGDKYEQEADAVASAAMHTPAPLPQPDANRGSIQRTATDEEPIQRQTPEEDPCPRCQQNVLQRVAANEESVQRQATEEKTLQRKGEGSPGVSPSTAATIHNPGSGAPLSPSIRHRVEPHVGANLSGVRVHTGPSAHRAAASLNARAFTHSNHIFLNRSESSQNLGLMAHESTHVVQQGAVPIQRQSLGAGSNSKTASSTPSPTPNIQRSLLGIDLEDFAEYADRIPGYPLFIVLIGYNPLTGRNVERNATNVIRGLMSLLNPLGTYVFDKLVELEILQRAFTWVDEELDKFDLSIERIERLLNEAWEEMDFVRLDPIDYNTAVLERKFNGLLTDVKNFADSLVDGLIDFIKEAAIDFAEPLLAENRAWALIKKILHYDPLRDEAVEASTVEILEDFLRLIDKEQELEQMRERGTLQATADWLDTQFALFTSLISQLRGIITDVWNTIQPENLPNLDSNLENLAGRVVGFLEGVWTFASTVALQVLELIKNALLGWLSTYANDIPGYHLLTVLVEQDPFTQEVVPRNATNLIRGFMSLIPGGEQQFQQMQETGVVPQAAQRIEGLMTELGITWPFVQQLFLDIWNDFTIEDLLKPVDAFIRVLQRFEEPLNRLFTFVIEVIKVVIELILVLMNFPTDLISSIITNAMQALDDIQQNPVGFLINLLETAKLGFQKFFDNIFENLLDGLTNWLFSTVREAGVEPPADFSFESILGFVLDVLGLTIDHLWELLANHIGEERVDQIRGAIDRVMEIAREAWGFIQDVQERGMVAVWEYIESQLNNLWDIVLQQVQDYVIDRVINVGMRWLMSLLDATGITPVINSFVAFFNAIQSAIQYLREMLEVVNDVVSTVASIARGDIEPGAARMEQGLKNSIPIVIGFIANQLGLGDLGQRLGEIIESIRGVVDQALNWLIEQALRIGGAILNRLGFGGESEEDAALQTGDPEHNAQVQVGLATIDEKESRVLQNGQITREAAEQIAAEILHEYPVFHSMEIVDGGTKWNYRHTASPTNTKTGENKAEEIILPPGVPNLSHGELVRIHTGRGWAVGDFQRFYVFSGTKLIEVQVGSNKHSKPINTFNPNPGNSGLGWKPYTVGMTSIIYGSLDSLQRPQGIQATLGPPLPEGTSASHTPVGYQDGVGHNRGHLLANQLGGSGSEPRNIVTIFAAPNSGIMRVNENRVRQAVENGGEIIRYTVTPIYNGSQLIPRAITLQATGDAGFSISISIPNRP